MIVALTIVCLAQCAVLTYVVFVARQVLLRWGEFLMARSAPELLAMDQARAGDEEDHLPRRKPNRWLG